MPVLVCDGAGPSRAADIGLAELLIELAGLGWSFVDVDGPGDDPRTLARVLRELPLTAGPRLYISGETRAVAAARQAGLDAHLYRGAAELRRICLEAPFSADPLPA